MISIRQYERILATAGVSLAAFGVREIALRTSDALDAIRSLEGSSVPILGGDVYVERSGRLELAYANWYVDRKDGETLTEFASRSYLKAADYIARYPQRTGEQPLFAFVLKSM